MAEKEVKTETKPISYPVEYLIENAAFFKVQREIVAGALTGKITATKEETVAAIKKHLTKPIATQKEVKA